MGDCIAYYIHHLKLVSNRISLPLGCRPTRPACFREQKTFTPVRPPLKGPPRKGLGWAPNDKNQLGHHVNMVKEGPSERHGCAAKRNLRFPPPLCRDTIGSQNKFCSRTEWMHFCCEIINIVILNTFLTYLH